jgi:putative Mg2+ transporter-C (MgtC) family protein
VSGIGFLGAGAIIRNGLAVRGLTTAASLWVVAAIGMATAFGEYVLAGFTTALTLLSLFALKRMSLRYFSQVRPGHDEFVIEAGPELDLGRLVLALSGGGARIDRLTVDEDAEGEPGSRRVKLTVKLPMPVRDNVVAAVAALPGVRDVDFSH